jgi:hypothetical protein
MPRRLSFIAVEGQHDAAFIGKLLKDAGFQLVQKKDEDPSSPGGLFVDSSLARLVPEDFPQNNDLLARVPIPFFWQKDTHAIALRPANGESKLISSAATAIRTIRPAVFGSIGIVLDADNKGVPADRMPRMQRAVEAEAARIMQSVGFEIPAQAGAVAGESLKCGVFIMPDNHSAGTLEDLLLDCADQNYADLKSNASAYLSNINRALLEGDDLDEIGALAGEKKAQVGVIASVLKPGKAIQNSISDNRWLEGAAKVQPRVEGLRRFLRELLGEPSI